MKPGNPLTEPIFEATNPASFARKKEVFVYEAGTSTQAQAYLDADLTEPATQPLLTDEGGRVENEGAVVYFASGEYELEVEGQRLPWKPAAVDLSGYQTTSEKGVANGYASLEAAGKVPAAQLPSAVMEYQGVWNATTNSPKLEDGKGSAGDVYRVSVAGERNLGSGPLSFEVGDYAVYSGSTWEKSDTTDAVASVAGKKGVVALGTGDIEGLVVALEGKQPLDADLTSIAALATAAFGRSLLTQASAPAARVTLGAQPTLGYTPESVANKDTDTSLAANSDTSYPSQKAIKSYVDSRASTDIKASVRAATTANITISTALKNGGALDGVTLVTGDRVLVRNQTTTKENGIWIVGGTVEAGEEEFEEAAPARSADADAAGELSGGTTVYVEEGTRNKRRVFTIVTAGSITPGTTSHEWAQLQGRDFGLVEALPTSEAVKGDRCEYVADKTNGIIWQLIYDGEGEYPWKKIGGFPILSSAASSATTESTGYVSLTGGPEVTAPLAGEYRVKYRAYLGTNGSGEPRMSVSIAGAAASDGDALLNDSRLSGTTYVGGLAPEWTLTKALAAGKTVVAKYRVVKAAGFFERRSLEIDPVRVA